MKNEYRFLLVLFFNIFIVVLVSPRFLAEKSATSQQNDSPQFAIICNAPGNNWEPLCNGIDVAANEYGVSIEYIVPTSLESMSDADSIYMAVESNVDGIAILQTSGNISEAVAYAVEKEIPVVTMVYDEPESTLDKFIGIDDVAYGECLLEAIQTAFLDEKDIQNVGLIYNGEINSKRAAAVESALCQNYNLQIADRASSNIFDTSDQVKELVINCEDLQVICCTDDNTTQGAAQAVIDWNMVSRLHIVGTGNSENVLSMVEKGIISATVAIDYQNIGRKTLEALYYSYNGTTSYLEDTENNLRVVTKETVRMYIEERNNAT